MHHRLTACIFSTVDPDCVHCEEDYWRKSVVTKVGVFWVNEDAEGQ